MSAPALPILTPIEEEGWAKGEVMNLRDGRAHNIGDFEKGGRDGKALGLAVTLALPVMLPMRKKVGKRRLGYGALVAATMLMLGVSWFGNLPWFRGMDGSSDPSVQWCAPAILVVGVVEHRKRVQELKRGEPVPTFSHGESRFTFLPLPKAFIGFVDAPIGFLAGALLHYRLHLLLGLWIMVASVAFLIVEIAVYRRADERFDDHVDTMLIAEMQSGAMSDLVGRKGSVARGEVTGAGEASIATGADAQLAAEIEKRRKANGAGSVQ